jgi:hypothetical protein
MTRANDKPFPCRDCRFRGCAKPDGGHLICRRNPPNCGESGDEFPMVWLDGSTNCFAGEPRVERSCDNCIKLGRISCQLFNKYEISMSIRNGWHCSEWEG